MFSYFSPEARVPAAHPLRSIKGYADTVLKSLGRDFDDPYAGRPMRVDRTIKAWSTSAVNGAPTRPTRRQLMHTTCYGSLGCGR